jgi:hypothetical protein
LIGGAGALGDEELRLLFQRAAGGGKRGASFSRMNPRLRRPVSTAGLRSLMENTIFDGDKGIGCES